MRGWVLGLLYGAFGLYEDQIGKFDWRREMIGYPKLVDFEQVKGPSEYITVYTNLGILASISARDGKIAWKRSIPKMESVSYVFGLRGVSVSISDTGIVRYWNSVTGVLNREVFSKTQAKVLTCSRLPSKNSIICSRQNQDENLITIFSDRAKLNEQPLPSPVQAILTDEAQNTGFLLGLDNEILTVQRLFLNDFSFDDQSYTITVPGLASLSDANLNAQSKLLYLSSGNLKSVDLIHGEISILAENLGACTLEPTRQTEARHATDSVLLNCADEAFLITNVDSPDERIVLQNKNLKIHRSMLNAFVSVQTAPNTFSIINFVDGKIVNAKTKNPVSHIWLNIFPTKTGHNFKVLSLGEDGSVRFGLKDQELWSREESLSEIARAEIIDLPPDSNHHVNPQEWSFSQRISVQVSLLQTWAASIWTEIESGNMFKSRKGDPLISDHSMYRDQFNIHKLIFIVTKNGNIFGLDSLNSSIKWKKRLENMQSCTFQTTTISDTNIRDGNILVTAKCENGKTNLVQINPMTGKMSKSNLYEGKEVLRVNSLRSHLDNVHPVVIFTKGTKSDEITAEVVGFDDSIDSIKSEILKELRLTSFWLVDHDMGQVKGGRIHLEENTFNGVFDTEWTFQAPGDHKIAAISKPHENDVIHSQGRPLADRSVLYKYLNPNMIALVTESGENSNVELMAVTVFLIDGVTGQLLHSANHKRAKGPVNIVVAENWVVYSYWAAKMHRTEVTSVELYMSGKESNLTHWNSRNLDLPMPIEKSFVLSEEITALGVTQSPRGITNKAVLLATSSGNIVSLPRIFLDPRRKMIPVPTDREEGIMPYEPEIKLAPNFQINYNMSIPGVEEIKIAITRLESTCIVFTISPTDLFWTRVQPSNMFDVLKDDFDHRMIVVIMIGFFLGTAACKRLAQLKITNRLWQ